MILRLATLPAGLALWLAASPTLAAGVDAATAAPQPARPAESGGHDSAATLGPLAIGATVRDASGAEVGQVTRVTTDKQGRQVAQVRHGGDVFSIPIGSLYVRNGQAFTSLSLDALRHGGGR